MQKLSVLVLASLFVLTGCNQLQEDVTNSASTIKSELETLSEDVQNAKNEIENDVNAAREVYSDIKDATEKIDDAANTIRNIGQ